MFTGLITHIAQITNITIRDDKDLILTIKIAKKDLQDNKYKIGSSIACSGTCLTLTKLEEKHNYNLFSFDISPETIDKTTIYNWKKGNFINVEFSLKIGDEIGGHLVSGHIHGVGIIKSINDRGQTKDLRIQPPASLMEYLFYKGYVGLNGCSLTIGKVFKSSFNIHLIPETIKVTNFQKMKKGDLINIEIDQTTINTVETIKKIMLERKV